jgi:hypothetical protein
VRRMLPANQWPARGVMVVVTAKQLFRIESRLTPIMTRLRWHLAPVLASLSCIIIAVTTVSAQITPATASLDWVPNVSASAVSPASVVHAYVSAAAAIPARGDIPPNMQVSLVYRQLVVKMLSRSPTFRRQMLRIAAASHLTVSLHSAYPSTHTGLRATTEFSRGTKGNLSATIEIVPLKDNIELIAHELEHVIEQLDGVDLAAKASRPNSGVYATGDSGNLFETTRAKRIGSQVAREVE